MRKIFICVFIFTLLASSSFALQSLFTAPGIGQGKSKLLISYGTDHWAPYQIDVDPTSNDTISTGLQWQFGLIDDLDFLLSYDQEVLDKMHENYASLGNISPNPGSSSILAFKKTFYSEKNNAPLDFAVALGYGDKQSSVNYNIPSLGINRTVYELTANQYWGYFFSKTINNMLLYFNFSSNGYTTYENVWANQYFSHIGMYSIGFEKNIENNFSFIMEYDFGYAEIGVGYTKAASPFGAGTTDIYTATISGLTESVSYRF